jgi:hypothetical protein
MLVSKEYDSVFQVSPLVRVVSRQSQWQEATLHYANTYGIYLETIQSARGMAEYTANSEHTDAIQMIIGDNRYQGNLNDTSVKIAKYLDSANQFAFRSPDDLPYAYVFHTLKGYGQGEWNEVVAYSNQMNQTELEGMIKNTIDTHYKGEVYEVSVEHAKVFTAQDGAELLQWETDTDFDYAEVVQEFFTLTADFVYETYGLEVLLEVEG